MEKERGITITNKDGDNVNTMLPTRLSTLKGYYIIGNIKGGAQTETISYQRKDAIKRFLEGSFITWEECKKVGWRCFKVDIVFKSCR